MATDTRRGDPILLGEVEAIVEAEWLKFAEDGWRREFADVLADTPVARGHTPKVATGNALRGRPGVVLPPSPSASHGQRVLRLPVSAKQRSPPVMR